MYESRLKLNILDNPYIAQGIDSGVIGIIIVSITLLGLSVFYWQFKRKVK